jgi:hypothetical protein
MTRAVLPVAVLVLLSTVSQVVFAQNPDHPSARLNAAPAPPDSGNWIISETTSPVDYSPQIAATLPSRLVSGTRPISLTVHCRRGRTEVSVRLADFSRHTIGAEVFVLYRVNAEPAIEQRWVEQRWKDLDRTTTLSFKGDAIGLLRSLPEEGRMFMRLYDRQSVPHDGEFHLAGWPMVRDRVAAACHWPSTTNKSSRR